jgi:hypothetical protein
MTAAARTDVRALLAAAAADGVQAVLIDGRLKLRGRLSALPVWTERLRPHRDAVIEHLRAAANDPAPTRPLQPRPAVIRQPQHPGDPQEEALALLDWLHALGVILTAEHGELRAHGTDTLPAELREEVDALMHPAVMGRDLLAAVAARDAAAAAIERAMPLQRCWGCAHLHTAQRGNPQCAQGHAVAWRQTGPGGVRTVPLRVSRRGPCADRVERSDADKPST